jgi:hypothetical protein
MPQILSKHENVVYLVAGATHPHIPRREGDKYEQVCRLWQRKSESNAMFHDRLSAPRMAEFIARRTSISLHIATKLRWFRNTGVCAGSGQGNHFHPYWHAIELLDAGRGALVPFQNPDAIALKTIELLTTPALRHAMRKRAYLFARDMV